MNENINYVFDVASSSWYYLPPMLLKVTAKWAETKFQPQKSNYNVFFLKAPSETGQNEMNKKGDMYA